MDAPKIIVDSSGEEIPIEVLKWMFKKYERFQLQEGDTLNAMMVIHITPEVVAILKESLNDQER